MHLLRALSDQGLGFYIDVGAGHPVYDNVSFNFYLRGWRGITVEPNPWLDQLGRAVRRRDVHVPALAGTEAREAEYYLVEHYHGLSTTIEHHARAAQSALGVPYRSMTVPVTTLRDLCECYAPAEIDFLKVDVEGAELTVLEGADWQKWRPKIIVVEALEPLTLQPAWTEWEKLLQRSQYRFALFDSLNRYYVADEHAALLDRLAAAPPSFDSVIQFSAFKPAAEDASHPDHALACRLSGMDMVRLPLLSDEAIAERLLAATGIADHDRPLRAADMDTVFEQLLATACPAGCTQSLMAAPPATIRDLYRGVVASEQFRLACGRISASSAW